ncbi:MAG: DNA polymerase IV [Treponema sp.]
MTSLPERLFLHLDMDAFFASIEQLDHPEWKGKPVIVGGLPENRRSVVSTASYEARKFGVHSAMPVAKAVKLCPHGIYTKTRIKRYAEVSREVMRILEDFSPDVFRISIDEACIDITGTEALFGTPEQTAQKIKTRIRKETGLTVSAGLASTRYLAKMASEMDKPDGFYRIPSGKEEEFMLSIPLKKIWGIGKKTLERLNAAGMYTARDIHEKPLELLRLMFGNAMGTFLYNTVRGIETERTTPETHSVSAETTYEYDLEDEYAAETALMELCRTVMFRLLEKKEKSRTLAVKIRYEDFSTVSVRESAETFITSADEMFLRAKTLFEKKYDSKRGIRLLGVAAENVESEETAGRQETLFDFGEKKKQAVEDAILKLQSQHPEIKIKKARLIDSAKKLKSFALIAGLAFLCAAFCAPPLWGEEARTQKSGAGSIKDPAQSALLPLPVEQPETLFNYNMGDSEVDFLANGYWLGSLSGGFNATFGGGTKSAFSPVTPVFTQETDLLLMLTLNNKWYFETTFSDKFAKNTIAAGYKGNDDEIVRHVRIANRGIVFPNIYSIDEFNMGIGGGKNQAPGVYAHFEDPAKKWRADAAVRYDMTQSKSATFYGKNAVSEKKIELSDYVSGRMYALDSAARTASVIAVYIEDKNGVYSDSQGRKYKKLDADSWRAEPARRLILLSSTAGAERKNGRLPAVAFEFSSSTSAAIFGSYANSSTFLGKIQTHFKQSAAQPDLAELSYDLDITINGTNMILAQSAEGFSPFVCAFRYKTGLASSSDVSVALKNTASQVPGFTALSSDETDGFVANDFFSEKHGYADVYNDSASGTDFSAPELRYPLASVYPDIYLNRSAECEASLLVRTYTPVNRYDIGTEAAENSVRVYRNGVQDTSATYDKLSGAVHILSAGGFDKIYITWDEEGADSDSGKISAEGAFLYNFLPDLRGDLAASVSWPVGSRIKYAQSGKDLHGYAALAAGLRYAKDDFLRVSNAAAASVETRNAAGKYRALSMENNPAKTAYWGKYDAKYIKSGYAPAINKRDYSTSAALNAAQNQTQEAEAQTDGSISGYAIPLKWNFSAAGEWAAVTIPTEKDLSSARGFTVALKTSDTFLDDVYIQLGVQADGSIEDEYAAKIPTWKISSSPPESRTRFITDGTKSGVWQEIEIRLEEKDRVKIQGAKGIRLITRASGVPSRGAIYAGPYEAVSPSMQIASGALIETQAESRIDNSAPDRGDFNSQDNYVQRISWKTKPSASSLSDVLVTAASQFTETDIASYKTVNFSFKYETQGSNPFGSAPANDDEAFTFVLDSDSPSLHADGKTAVKVLVKMKDLRKMQGGGWHAFAVDIRKSKVFIDGDELDAEVEVDTNYAPSRMKIRFTAANGAALPFTISDSGEFSIDELYFDGSAPYFSLQDKLSLTLSKKGAIFEANDFAIIEDALFKSTLTGHAVLPTEKEMQRRGTLSSAAEAGVTIAKIALSADADFSSAQKNYFVSGGHRIKSAVPLGKVFSFEERFSFDRGSAAVFKTTSAAIDMNAFKVPVHIEGSVAEQENAWTARQNAGALANSLFAVGGTQIKINAQAKNEQKKSAQKYTADIIRERDYFTAFLHSSKSSFSKGWLDASERTAEAEAGLAASFPVLSMAPSYRIAAEGRYKALPSAGFSDATRMTFTFPFAVRKNNFSFEYAKEGGGVKTVSRGGNYADDWRELKTSLSERDYYFLSAPFYDFFDKNLPSKMLSQKPSGTDSVYYAANYAFTWRRALFADIKDFFIPSRAEVSASRDIRAAAEKNDIYQLKASAINTAINVFGSNSERSLFKWYETDEFTLSLTVKARIPSSEPKNALYTFSSYGQAGFYFNSTDFLKAGAEFSVSSDKNWATEETLLWKRAGKRSPLKTLAEALDRKKKLQGVALSRTDSINVRLEQRGKILSRKYELTHRADLKLHKYVSVNASLIGAYFAVTDGVSRISVSATLGGKVEF